MCKIRNDWQSCNNKKKRTNKVHAGALGRIYTKPGLLAEKKQPSKPQLQKEYSNDGLSGHTVSSLNAVRHRYILDFIVCSVFFFRLQYGLVYLGPKPLHGPANKESRPKGLIELLSSCHWHGCNYTGLSPLAATIETPP